MKTLSVLLILIVTAASPSAAQDMAATALGDPYFDWKSVENGAARVYFKSGSFAETHRHMLLRSVTTAISEDLEFLGETTAGPVLTVFYVDDRADMERITGGPVTGFAHWGANAIFLVCSPDWRSFEKHEFAHIVTMGRWGTPHESSHWMIEGIAVAADGWCGEYGVDAIASFYLRRGELPLLSELPGGFRELGEIRGGICAASVLSFVRREYGPAAVREIWREGLDAWIAGCGLTVEGLGTSWRRYLSNAREDGNTVDIEAINERGCG